MTDLELMTADVESTEADGKIAVHGILSALDSIDEFLAYWAKRLESDVYDRPAVVCYFKVRGNDGDLVRVEVSRLRS